MNFFRKTPTTWQDLLCDSTPAQPRHVVVVEVVVMVVVEVVVVEVEVDVVVVD